MAQHVSEGIYQAPLVYEPGTALTRTCVPCKTRFSWLLPMLSFIRPAIGTVDILSLLYDGAFDHCEDFQVCFEICRAMVCDSSDKKAPKKSVEAL